MNAAGSSFVINLCSSTSPVALAPPDHAGLKRFTFFVSRRREEGRERFRLHMGYFETQEEAEKLLDIVREIYPGAWAGLAPGQRLRAAAAAAAAQAPAAALGQEVAPARPRDSIATAALTAPPAAVAAKPEPSPAQLLAPSEPAAPVVTGPAAAKVPQLPEQEVSFQLLPDDGARRRPDSIAAQPAHTLTASAKTPENPASTAVNAEAQAATRSLNNVRAAIASLEDSTVHAPVLKPPADLKIPELKAAVIPVSRKPLEKPAAKPVEKPADKPVPAEVEVLNDEAAMLVLESADSVAAKSTDGKAGVGPAAEKPCYAVQLIWSVKPIDVSQVPQLAIFSAYTLYGAEGNRDGRRWYGLRLGFFTDAVSAKQVAHYVRSEFSTVSVVPVTTRERERAKNAARPGELALQTSPPAKPATAVIKPAPGTLVSTTQFEFIEDKAPAPSEASAAPQRNLPPRLGPAARTVRGAPGKRAKLRTPAQMAAKAAAAKPKKLTLEETLEILGAGDLKVDDGRGELLNTQSAANAAAPKSSPANKGKSSRLGRLFERLSERIGN
ncbi:MAG TPA: hypothetical protein VNZ06_02770 [Steroidobacteraceae bacterium]|nr:hypothetical protein [Steroidobacteraceae bacterium]